MVHSYPFEKCGVSWDSQLPCFLSGRHWQGEFPCPSLARFVMCNLRQQLQLQVRQKKCDANLRVQRSYCKMLFFIWWKGELNNCRLEIDCWDSWNILDDGKGLERSQRKEVKAQHLQVNLGYDSFFRDLEARPDEWPDSSKPLWCGKGSDLVTDPSLGVDTIYISTLVFLRRHFDAIFRGQIPRIADRLLVGCFCSRNLTNRCSCPRNICKHDMCFRR